MPAARAVQVNVDCAHLVADPLFFDNAPRGPQAGGDGDSLIELHFNVRGIERFIPDWWSFDRRDPLSFVHLLAMRERSCEIVAVHAMKISTVLQLNGVRGFFLQADDFLPMHFRVAGRIAAMVT